MNAEKKKKRIENLFLRGESLLDIALYFEDIPIDEVCAVVDKFVEENKQILYRGNDENKKTKTYI